MSQIDNFMSHSDNFCIFWPEKACFCRRRTEGPPKKDDVPESIQTFEDIRRDGYVYVDNSSDVPGLRFGNVIDTAHARSGPGAD